MPHRTRPLPLTTAAQAAARDRAAIGAGVDSFDLMVRAGTATAEIILRDYADRLSDGVAIFAGHGNNGGDGYIVAAQLLRAGVRVRLHASAPPRTDDAQRAAAIVSEHLRFGAPHGNERLVVDALLGTGHTGVLRDDVAIAVERLGYARDRGAIIVALDVPSGLDASTGDIAAGIARADVTVSYGTIKRGQLLSRDVVGRLLLVDIGLDGHAHLDDQAWQLAETHGLHHQLQPVAWNSWKTRRGVVGMVGGTAGMAGAAVIATRAALSAGAGLVHAMVHRVSRSSVQIAVPQAITHTFDDDLTPLVAACDAIAVGPGLGRNAQSMMLMQRLLSAPALSLVLDADALTLLAQQATGQGTHTSALLSQAVHDDRRVICTPHPGEFMRMLGEALPASIAARAERAQSFAITSRTTVLLKGTPTIICTPDGAAPVLVARGTPALATGGSGDMLTGIIATLLAQQVPAPTAAATGAWLHGRAAELATAATGTTRGVGLDRIDKHLVDAWRELEQPANFPPSVITELPAVALPADTRVHV